MRTLVLGTALLALMAGAAAAQQVVRLATEGAYPPYNFINDAGKVDGYDSPFASHAEELWAAKAAAEFSAQ